MNLPLASAVDRLISMPGEALHASHVIDLEVAQTLRKLVRARAIDAVRGEEALTDFAALNIQRHEHLPLLSRIWELRDNLTAYDAAYVALAEVLNAPLLTCDAKLARSPGHSAKIALIST